MRNVRTVAVVKYPTVTSCCHRVWGLAPSNWFVAGWRETSADHMVWMSYHPNHNWHQRITWQLMKVDSNSRRLVGKRNIKHWFALEDKLASKLRPFCYSTEYGFPLPSWDGCDPPDVVQGVDPSCSLVHRQGRHRPRVLLLVHSRRSHSKTGPSTKSLSSSLLFVKLSVTNTIRQKEFSLPYSNLDSPWVT